MPVFDCPLSVSAGEPPVKDRDRVPVGLFEMIRLNLGILITITDQLRSFQRELRETPDAVIDPAEHSIVQLKQCHELFSDLKLKISGKYFHRMIVAVDQGGFTYGECARMIDTLIILIIDELSEKLILQIWDHKRSFYDDLFLSDLICHLSGRQYLSM